MNDFFSGLTLDGMIQHYVELETAKASEAGEKYQVQAVEQVETLHTPEHGSATEAVDGGNAVAPGQEPASAGQAYIDRIPKELLYGSLALLGGALLIKAVT